MLLPALGSGMALGSGVALGSGIGSELHVSVVQHLAFAPLLKKKHELNRHFWF